MNTDIFSKKREKKMYLKKKLDLKEKYNPL
jgi:hypothetical protein